MRQAAKKPTNVSLPQGLVDEAKSLGVSLSRACERGLREEIAQAKAERWLVENQEAIADWNRYVAENGLPLARFRQF